jgi:hypothetical protein
MDIFSGAKLDQLFPLVLKYSMGGIEENILERLKVLNSLEDAMNLIVVAQKLNDGQQYQRAKSFLKEHEDCFSLEHARRIGVDATYEIMAARQVDRHFLKCSVCRGGIVVCQRCPRYY